MSASGDNNSKVKFIFPNLYRIHGKSENQEKSQKKVPSNSKVIKAEDLNSNTLGAIRVNPYTPKEVVGKRVNRPEYLPAAPVKAKTTQSDATHPVEGLKQNLKSLNDLQARLRFMLKELEDLIQE